MEWIEITERTSEYIRLRYYPNQNSAAGNYSEVRYYFATDKWTFDKISAGTNYAMHAVNFARKHYKAGEEIPHEGLVTWY